METATIREQVLAAYALGPEAVVALVEQMIVGFGEEGLERDQRIIGGNLEGLE